MDKKKQTGKKEPNKANANEPAASALTKRNEEISKRMRSGDYIDPFPFDKDPADDRVFDLHTGPTILHAKDYLFLRDTVENMEEKYLHYSTEIKDEALRIKTYTTFLPIQAFIKKTFKRLELLLSGYHYYSTPSAKRPFVKPSSLFDPCSIEDYLNCYIMIGVYYNDSRYSYISAEMKEELSKDIHLMLTTTFDVLAAMLPCKEVSDLRNFFCRMILLDDPRHEKRLIISKYLQAVSGALANEEPKWECERLARKATEQNAAEQKKAERKKAKAERKEQAEKEEEAKKILMDMRYSDGGRKGQQTEKKHEQLNDFCDYVRAKTGEDFPKEIWLFRHDCGSVCAA